MNVTLIAFLAIVLSMSLFARPAFAVAADDNSGDDSKSKEKDKSKDPGPTPVTSVNNHHTHTAKKKPITIPIDQAPGTKCDPSTNPGIDCVASHNTGDDKPSCDKPKILLSNGDCVDSHTDRPDNDCRFNPGLGKCQADCTQDKSFCECPSGFVMNENDHCTPDKPCPKGFEQHADDETSTCFPTKALLHRDHNARPIIRNNINIDNSVSASAAASAATTTTTTGFNSTFWNSTIPYCWYTVNAPPCFDTSNNSLHD